MTKPAITTDAPPKKKTGVDGATDREKERIDDAAVEEAVTVEEGTRSVLPGPPILPGLQDEARKMGNKKRDGY